MAKFSSDNQPAHRGRPKGSKNFLSSELRIRVHDVLNDHFTANNLKVVIDSLEPKEKFQALLKLLEFALPKLRSVESTFDLDSLSEDQIQELYNRIASTKKSAIDLERLSFEDREEWYKLMEKATVPDSESQYD